MMKKLRVLGAGGVPTPRFLSAGVHTFAVHVQTTQSIFEYQKVYPEINLNLSSVKTNKKSQDRYLYLVFELGYNPTPIHGFFEYFNKVESEVKYPLRIVRLDFAFDFNRSLNYGFNTYQFIIETIAEYYAISDIYQTVIRYKKTGNLKASKGLVETTIYCCEDKHNRTGNARLEIRYILGQNKYSNTRRIKEALYRLRILLKSLPEYIDEVERMSIKYLMNKKEIEKFPHFSDFLTRYRDYAITKDALKEVYAKYCKGNFNHWIKDYEKSRERVVFANKARVNKIINQLYLEVLSQSQFMMKK